MSGRTAITHPQLDNSGPAQAGRWIEDEGAFPGSMVDRITPATTADDRERIVRSLGVDDGWPVITEPSPSG